MNFRTYVICRVLYIIPALLGLIVLIFLISRILPGDPARIVLGPYASSEHVEKFRHEMGLDKPIPIQFFDYITGLLKGDWGKAYKTNTYVLDDLVRYFPATFELVTFAMFIAISLGIPLGVIASFRRNRLIDNLSRISALFGVSMPHFWSGLMIQMIFAFGVGIGVRLLPAVGRFDYYVCPPPQHITGLYILDSILTLNGEALVNSLGHIILPAITLSVSPLAELSRMTRANMIDETTKDYILTGISNGIPETLIKYKYMLKKAFSATLTYIGLDFGILLGLGFVVETIFSWPGIGYYGVQAILLKDFNCVVGVTIIYGIFFMAVNLIVDVLYGYLDPRIRYGE